MRRRQDHAVELGKSGWYVRHRPTAKIVAGPFGLRTAAEANANKRDKIAADWRTAKREAQFAKRVASLGSQP